MCLTFGRVCSSLTKYSALLQVDLSMFVIGQMLQTASLLCDALMARCEKPGLTYHVDNQFYVTA